MFFQNVPDLEESGWFQEAHSQTDKFGTQWAMTPSHKLLPQKDEKDIILLSTGGFAPIHYGHIAMMEAAKLHMESQGFRVRGGYVSPGHDDYVTLHKGVPLYAPERIAYANNGLKDHDWLMVDPWEALGCTCSVNFTKVIEHLESLLNCRVCFVVGSDNARFSLAFKEQGLLCVVRRTEDVLPNEKYRSKNYLIGTDRVFIADNKPISGSSTQSRRNMSLTMGYKKKLILRCDDASDPYLDRLAGILIDYYMDIKFTEVSRQSLPKIPNLISMDQMMRSSFGNLEMSRNYVEGGYYKLGYINRPSTPPLREQVKAFSGQYVSLFDDDIATGGSMTHAISLLRGAGSHVIEYCTYSRADKGTEIMDSRDLLPLPDSGLVVQGKRVPYIYPYVCPHVRASVLPQKAVEFSDRIRKAFWE